MKTQILISLLAFSLLGAACTSSAIASIPPTNVDPTTDACRVNIALCETLTPGTGDLAQARGALEAFFDALHAGAYEKAAEIYGGSYESLIDINPEVDPNNHAALLERACTVNGFQCLKVKEVVREKQDWPDTFTCTVEFTKPDGSLFVLGKCCGASETDSQPQSQFDFTVMRIPQLGGAFRVQGLPVYVP